MKYEDCKYHYQFGPVTVSSPNEMTPDEVVAFVKSSYKGDEHESDVAFGTKRLTAKDVRSIEPA